MAVGWLEGRARILVVRNAIIHSLHISLRLLYFYTVHIRIVFLLNMSLNPFRTHLDEDGSALTPLRRASSAEMSIASSSP